VIWSLKNKADEIGYELLTRLNALLKELISIKIRITPYYVGKEIFIAYGEMGILDYDFNYMNNTIEYGVRFLKNFSSSIITRIKINTNIYVKIPETPYYSSPLYIWRRYGTVILSPWRVPVLILATLYDGVKPNLDYISSLVIQGYPIEGDEVHSNVKRLPIGSETIITSSLAVEVKELIGYDETLNPDVDKIVALLLEGGEAFLTWASEKKVEKIKIGLSGGLDSRTISTVLAKIVEKLGTIEIEAYTNKLPTTDPKEIEIAKNIAKTLGLKHRVIYVDPRGDDPRKILQNMLGIMRPSNDVIAEGTGGDKTLAPLGRLKWRNPKTLEAAAISSISRYDYTTYSKQFYKILKPWRRRLINKLLQTKEKTPLGLLRRYLVESRMSNWLTAFGRPRITPFLYPPYFSYAFRIRPEAKDYYVLYSRVLERLDPRLLSIPYYNLGCKLVPNPILQRAKITLYFFLTSMKKLSRGQRGSLVPTRQAYDPLERLYHMLKDKLSYINISKDNYLINALLKEADRITDLKILDARTIVVFRNILRCLAELLFLHLSTSS